MTVPSGRQIHRGSTRAFSLLMIGLGIAMIAVTVANGGGVIALGVVLGILFVAAGGARLYLLARD